MNYFSADEEIEIKALTWNISDDAQVSDGGIERLTVWYAKENDKEKTWTDSYRILPVSYNEWNIFMQFW